MSTESPTVGIIVSMDMLGVVLEAARGYASHLRAQANVPDDTPYRSRSDSEPLLGYRNREEATREADEIMQAARHIAAAAQR